MGDQVTRELLRELVAQMRAQGSAVFESGLQRGRPGLDPSALTQVGFVDFKTGSSLQVGVSFPRAFMDAVDDAPVRGLIDRLLAPVVRRGLRWMDQETESRYEAGACLSRGRGDEEWIDVSLPERLEDRRPNSNDATWILRALEAPAEALSDWAWDEPGRRNATGRVDLLAIADALPIERAENLRDGNNDTIRLAQLNVTLNKGGLPDRVALSASKFTDTGEPSWISIAFQEFGSPYDPAALWARWDRARTA